MKKLILPFVLLLATAAGFAQSLSLSNIHGPITANSIMIQPGTPDSVELITYLYVTNNSSASKDILCKKTELSLLGNVEVTMCWAGGCYSSTTFVSPNAQAIAPGETDLEFSGHYTQINFQPIGTGESVIRWTFFDRVDPNDSVSVTVKYTTFPVGQEERTAARVSLSDLSPNPASGNVTAGYSLPAGSQGTLAVRNMLGTLVMELPLSGSGKTTLSTTGLRDGIYFCTLTADGKAGQTRKLIVKH